MTDTDEKYTGAGMLPPQERAANGARLLDERGPLGWRYTLDDTLNMWTDCVLQRVYGGYVKGLEALGIDMPLAATHYGFCPAGGEEEDGDYSLRDAWLVAGV